MSVCVCVNMCVCVSMHASVCMRRKLVQMPKSQELAVFVLTKQITLPLAYARGVTLYYHTNL